MAMVVDNKFDIGQFVYLVTDIDQLKRIVTSILINKNEIVYELSCGPNTCKAFDFEMSLEKSIEFV